MNEAEERALLQQQLDALQRRLDAQQEEVDALRRKLGPRGVAPLVPSPPQTADSPSPSLENFIGLRLIHLIGIVVLVIGLSIGVKYAIDRDLISAGARIGLAYAAGALLYLLSVRLRKQYVVFSAILFSGGMASLYFTTYAGHVFYQMFPFAAAFAFMILLTAYTAFEALRYDREEIALLGLIGAYGIPFLISKNADRADLFFLYIAIINAGVGFLYVKKQWRRAGAVALLITWLLFNGWASTRYEADRQDMATVFLLLFFFGFLLALLLLRRTHRRPFSDADHYQLLLDHAGFYMGIWLIVGPASSAGFALPTLGMAALTALESFLLMRYCKEEKTMARKLAYVSLLFFIGSIGLYWDGFTVTLLWLLTACVIFGWGFFTRSIAARLCAILLIGLTLAKLLAVDSRRFTAVQKVVAYLVLGVLLLVVSFFYQRFRQRLFNEDVKRQK